LPPGVKRAGREDDHSPTLTVVVKNECRYTLCLFDGQRAVHRNIFL